MQFDLSKLRINRIYSVTTIYTTAGDTRKRRLRPSWAIIYKWEGETLYTYGDGKVLISNSQNSVILPKGSSYMWKCTKEGRYSIIEFDSDMECEEIFGFHITDGNKLLSYFKKLERARILQLPYYEIEELSGAYRILHTFLINAPTKYVPSEKRQKIQPAVDYILQHYDEKIANEELAKMTSVSTVYFRKIFTQVFGMGPMRYVQHIRISKAKEMLRSDFGSIADIAFSLGYKSIYHFSKAFKEQIGMSPTAYIKEYQDKTKLR